MHEVRGAKPVREPQTKSRPSLKGYVDDIPSANPKYGSVENLISLNGDPEFRSALSNHRKGNHSDTKGVTTCIHAVNYNHRWWPSPDTKKEAGRCVTCSYVARLRLTQTRVVTVPTWQATIVWILFATGWSNQRLRLQRDVRHAHRTRLRSENTTRAIECNILSRQVHIYIKTKIKNTPAIVRRVVGRWSITYRRPR